MTAHLVGAGEVAEMLGVTPQRVHQIAKAYPDFPEPEVSLSVGRVWARAKVKTWADRHPERGPGTRIVAHASSTKAAGRRRKAR